VLEAETLLRLGQFALLYNQPQSKQSLVRHISEALSGRAGSQPKERSSDRC